MHEKVLEDEDEPHSAAETNEEHEDHREVVAGFRRSRSGRVVQLCQEREGD